MTQEHPITPPPELVQQWWDGTHGALYEFEAVTTQAARWGSDQELEACCEWFQEFYKTETWVDLDLRTFRAARRPKPPSLKEQALEIVRGTPVNSAGLYSYEHVEIIRRALEQLDD
jgi:hypothetical protein